eukprot:Nk52_evm39s2209 gene=Nk52_evmTU39s2209
MSLKFAKKSLSFLNNGNEFMKKERENHALNKTFRTTKKSKNLTKKAKGKVELRLKVHSAQEHERREMEEILMEAENDNREENTKNNILKYQQLFTNINQKNKITGNVDRVKKKVFIEKGGKVEDKKKEEEEEDVFADCWEGFQV